MKKRTLLSFAAATAICAATAGSYAAWDSISATATGSIEVASRINVTAQAMNSFKENRELMVAPFYNANAIFDLSSVELDMQTDMKFELSISVKNGDTEVDSGAYTVEVTKDTTAIPLTNTKYIDVTPRFTSSETYAVKVTLKDTQTGTDLAGKDLAVTVTGTLVK